jgi:putative endonuclease
VPCVIQSGVCGAKNPGSESTMRKTSSRKSYYVYIMSSPSRTLYTGVTNDLERRVNEHKSGAFDSFTKRYRVDRLVYFQETNDINAAIAAEKQIKGISRSKKIALIEAENPTWQDLSAESNQLQSSKRTGILRRSGSE